MKLNELKNSQSKFCKTLLFDKNPKNFNFSQIVKYP